jgi:hypothetical protein
MKAAALVAGVACWAAVAAMAQAPAPHSAQRFDNLKERKPEQAGQPARQGVAAPMNMRIRGDGLALPPGVGRDAEDQREEQKEREAAPAAAPAAGETTKKP